MPATKMTMTSAKMPICILPIISATCIGCWGSCRSKRAAAWLDRTGSDCVTSEMPPLLSAAAAAVMVTMARHRCRHPPCCWQCVRCAAANLCPLGCMRQTNGQSALWNRKKMFPNLASINGIALGPAKRNPTMRNAVLTYDHARADTSQLNLPHETPPKITKKNKKKI